MGTSTLDTPARRAAPSHRASVASIAVLIVVWAGAVLPHVKAGGFHADDWVDAGLFHFNRPDGLWAAKQAAQLSAQRDSWSIFRTIEFELLGTHSARHLALTALIALAEAALIFLLARRLGSPRGPATAVALLVILFPAADSGRLWATGMQPSLFCGCLLIGGVLVALRGLDIGGRRGAALHGLALVMYAVSVNGYELGAPLILAAGLLYLRNGPRRAALWRWAADIVVVLAVLVRYSNRRDIPLPQLHEMLDHGRLIVENGAHVLARALVPISGMPTGLVLGATAAVLVAAGVASVRAEVPPGVRADLRLGLRIVGVGAAAALLGWLMLVPADPGYLPSNAGVGNRINAVAAFGLAACVAGVAVLLAAPIRLLLRERSVPLGVLVTLLLVPVAVGDFVSFRADARDWDHAAARNRDFLHRLNLLVPDPPAGTMIFTFGVSGYAAPSVPIFGGGGNDDLVWAARLLYDRESVSAFPVLGGMAFDCGASEMSLKETGAQSTAAYGRVKLVDMHLGRVLTPATRTECLAQTESLMPYAPVNEHE